MLPVFRRFAVGDYPTAPNWLGNMFQSLNTFSETTVQTLNKNLTIGQNVQGQKYSTSITTPSDYLTGGFQTITLSYTGGGQPNCCIVGNITATDGTAILFPVTITSWYLNINRTPFQVVINYIAGLDPSMTYDVVLLVI